MIKDNSKRKENKIMKKILLTLSLVLLAVAFMYGSASAGVEGQICSACHTMHNSQNGTFATEAGKLEPNDQLLKADCLACHTGDGKTNTDFEAPVVLEASSISDQGGTATNAGGNFYWVATVGDATDSMGHNVDLLAGTDTAIAANLGDYVPPGYNSGIGAVAGGSDFDTQLTCAGEFGCHGDHTEGLDNWAGIKGAHHSNTGGSATVANSATTIGNSYRFLLGIKGLEDVNWNNNESTSSHNEYFGQADLTGRNVAGTVSGGTDTISYACAQCHGDFHTDIDADDPGAAPWRRHPTDIVLPSGEYQSYNGGSGYNLEAPVARGSVPTASSSSVDTDGTGGDGAIVMCLSCHRAHGSPEPDLLRWDYDTMNAGTTDGSKTGTGCFVCHTEKDGV
jgi:hypothetical protein